MGTIWGNIHGPSFKAAEHTLARNRVPQGVDGYYLQLQTGLHVQVGLQEQP